MCVCVLSCMHAKSILSCLTLCDPMDCSPPGFSVPGILQARILEWVAISFNLSATGKPLKGTSGGLIAILYFKHSFALEPVEVSESSSHSELRPSTAAHHLPVQWKQGVPEKGSPELGAHVCGLCRKNR